MTQQQPASPDAPVKVSVSIVTYNHERFLGPCLDSVLSQVTRFPFEIVVGEDASTDGTAAVLRDYAARHPGIVRPIFHERNVGVNRNWQAVLDACRGEYIAHLDGDDLMRPGKLQRQVELLDARPDVAMCFHNMAVFDSDTGRVTRSFTLPGHPRVETLDDLVRHGTVYCHSSKMYRRSALPPEGLDRDTHLVMDWLVHLQNARHGRVAYLDEVLGDYRKHGGGTTALGIAKAGRLMADQLHTIEKGAAFGASEDAVRHAKARILFAFAMRFLEAGEDAEFRRTIEESGRDGAWISRQHRMVHRLRRTPRLVRGLAAAYERLVIARRLGATRAGADPAP